MKKLMELMAKKKEEGKMISPMEKDAKMGVLKDLHKMASDSMAEKVNGIKKVSVAAPDKKGLETGLDKAKQIVKDMPGMSEDAEDGDGRDGDEFAGGDDEQREEDAHMDLDGDNEEGEDADHVEKVMGHMSHEMAPGEHDDMDESEIDAKLAELMKKKEMMKSKKA